MALTPQDVRDRRFTPVRLREGYDMAEVDAFLDEVEAELQRLIEDNDALREQVESAPASDGDRPTAAAEAAATPVGPRETSAGAASGKAEPEKPDAAPPASIPEASSAAARLLEIATRNADELVSEAQERSEQLLATTRSECERLEAETKEKAQRLEGDARSRSEELDRQTAERRAQLSAALERDRETLSQQVEELRGFEREYRSRLKAYFEQQLAALDGESDGAPTSTPLAPAAATAPAPPPRLSSLLAEEE
jgi:DivIVA domain-containing protein